MKTLFAKDEAGVIDLLVVELERSAENALRETGVFRVGLSGGSLLNYLSVAIPRLKCDLTKFVFYFCDERYVDTDDPDSTFGCYKTSLVKKTALTEAQFANINLELPLEECARDYEQRIRKDFKMLEANQVPSFDLLLLGMGPDGHTCSLFPGHALLKEQNRLIAPITDSPKPPPQRVTMTFTLLNNAKCCLYAMCGAGKADMVKRVFVDKEALPAGMVNPRHGELIGIFDEAAGIYLL